MYRCLDKTDLKLFENDIISCRRHGVIKDKAEEQLNTHNYETSKNQQFKLHFFLFFEDAFNYLKKYAKNSSTICEYEIDDDLIFENIGCGKYTLFSNILVLEAAIPFSYLTDEEIVLKYIRCENEDIKSATIINYYDYTKKISIQTGVKKLPSFVSKTNICSRIIKEYESIKLDDYDNFVNDLAICEILKALNINIKKDREFGFVFDFSNRSIDIDKIKQVLIKYNLVEKDKKIVKTQLK